MNELYNELHAAVDTNAFLTYQIDMLENNGWELDSRQLTKDNDSTGCILYTWEWYYYNEELDDLTLIIKLRNECGWIEIVSWDIEKGIEI